MDKKLNLMLLAPALIIVTLLQSCDTSSEKVNITKENMTEAEERLSETSEKYLEDIRDYEKEAAHRIADNEKYISDFRIEIENEKNEAKVEYLKRIAKLEQENKNMETKIITYKARGKENWEMFKVEFSRDMDELSKALKNLTVKNVK